VTHVKWSARRSVCARRARSHSSPSVNFMLPSPPRQARQSEGNLFRFGVQHTEHPIKSARQFLVKRFFFVRENINFAADSRA
jgi:hypothetical protein